MITYKRKRLMIVVLGLVLIILFIRMSCTTSFFIEADDVESITLKTGKNFTRMVQTENYELVLRYLNFSRVRESEEGQAWLGWKREQGSYFNEMIISLWQNNDSGIKEYVIITYLLDRSWYPIWGETSLLGILEVRYEDGSVSRWNYSHFKAKSLDSLYYKLWERAE